MYFIKRENQAMDLVKAKKKKDQGKTRKAREKAKVGTALSHGIINVTQTSEPTGLWNEVFPTT